MDTTGLISALNLLRATKESIRGALIDKGVDVEAGEPFASYPDKIESISVGTSESPTLNTPSISRSGDAIIFSNPSTNGNFMKTYKLYNNFDLVSEQTSSRFSIKSLPGGEYNFNLFVTGDGFKNSARSNYILCYCYTINYELNELAKNSSEIRISNNQTHSVTLTPTNGWWLPEFIEIYINNSLYDSSNYSYNSYTGAISIVAVGDIKIVASADEEPNIRTCSLDFDSNNYVLTTDYPKYTQFIDIYHNDELVHTEEITSDLATQLVAPTAQIDKSLLATFDNSDFNNKKTYNVIFEIYHNDELIIEEKKGI